MKKIPHPMDKHHRMCRSNGGSNKPDNISLVPSHQHRAWHTLFANLLPPQIAEIINKTWISREWRMVAFKVDLDKPRRKSKVIYNCP